MEVQRVSCDPHVAANRGRVAIQRGPLTYNVEDVDHSQPVQALVLKPDLTLDVAWKSDLLNGVMVVQGEGFMAIPNFVRLNRGGASQVWVIEDPTKITAVNYGPESNIDLEDVDDRTVDVVHVGVLNSESDHALQSDNSAHGRFRRGHWRHASNGGWFSYRMKVDSQSRQSVFCVYWGSDNGNRQFAIRVDGQEIGTQVLDNNQPDQFFAVEYAIPDQLVKGKDEVTVQLAAEPEATAGGIFDLRILRTRP